MKLKYSKPKQHSTVLILTVTKANTTYSALTVTVLLLVL